MGQIHKIIINFMETLRKKTRKESVACLNLFFQTGGFRDIKQKQKTAAFIKVFAEEEKKNNAHNICISKCNNI